MVTRLKHADEQSKRNPMFVRSALAQVVNGGGSRFHHFKTKGSGFAA